MTARADESTPPPVRITIERMGHRGDGIAMVNGEPLHVPKVLPGEQVQLLPGEPAKVLLPSPERITPFCKHYATCGGCKFQHWQLEPYRAWKRSLLVAALQQADVAASVLPLVDAHGAGRRRATFHVRQQQGRWVAGFMEQKSHAIVALDTCPVLVPVLVDMPSIAARFGPPLGESDVTLVATSNGVDVSIKARRQAVPARHEVLASFLHNPQIARLTINGELFAKASEPSLRMGKATVKLPAGCFLQATAEGERVLSTLVLEGVGKAKTVADLFCGIGPFALRLAEQARVQAFDSDKPAIAALQQAVRNTQGLKPLDANVRDLFREPLVPQELKEFDAVVLDPPRAGAEAQVQAIAKSAVKRVVYVSCDANTFARDAATLVAAGFKLRDVTPVDQFKFTAHLEMVGVFTR